MKAVVEKESFLWNPIYNFWLKSPKNPIYLILTFKLEDPTSSQNSHHAFDSTWHWNIRDNKVSY